MCGKKTGGGIRNSDFALSGGERRRRFICVLQDKLGAKDRLCVQKCSKLMYIWEDAWRNFPRTRCWSDNMSQFHINSLLPPCLYSFCKVHPPPFHTLPRPGRSSKSGGGGTHQKCTAQHTIKGFHGIVL